MDDIKPSLTKYLGPDGYEQSASHVLPTFAFVRHGYGVEAFPKIRHLHREYQIVIKSLQPIRDILKMTITNDFTKTLMKFFSELSNKKGNRGVILVPTEKIFAYRDVFENPDIKNIYVHIIGTQENVEVMRKLVSPKYEPKSTVHFSTFCDYLGSIDAKHKENPCIRSPLYGPPEVYICWIPKQFHQDVQHQVSEILVQLTRRTHIKIIFVTDNENISDVKEYLRRTYDTLDECHYSDFSTVCTPTQENVRKHTTFSLSEYIFGRLMVLKEILLECEKNIRNIPRHQDDKFSQCISETIQKIPDEQVPSGNDVSEVSGLNQECQRLCRFIEKKVFYVSALLHQDPRKEKNVVQKEIPQDIVNNLFRLTKRGVEAFSLWSDEFRVYINCGKLKEDDIKKLETEIRDIIPEEFARLNILRCKGEMIVKYVQKGDKLFLESKGVGTLGIFARDSSNNLIALTSEHVICIGRKAYVDIDGQRVDLGICHKTTAKVGTPNHSSDISLIKIHQENYSRCNIEFKSQTDEVLEPHLFTGENVDLPESIVYKKGATSNWTTGRIRGNIQTYEGVSYIVVESLDEQFAKPGDSGSIVFTYDKTDPENAKIYLVSMVVGGTEESGVNEVFTYRLDEALQKLPPHSVNFDHQN